MLRRYLAEFIGTFFIVFAPVEFLGAMAGTGGHASLLEAALVSGLAVMIMISALGPISAAHFNPAVTLAFFAARRFPGRYVAPYIAAQVLGGIAAAALGAAMHGAGPGAHVPVDGNMGRNLVIEITITFLLMLVIMAMATDRHVPGSMPAPAIGFAVVVGVLMGGPITGGSMNPARSIGPALMAGGPALANVWIYFLGPIIGAGLGALAFEGLRLRREDACGAPEI